MRAAVALITVLAAGSAAAVKVTIAAYPLVCGHPTGLLGVTFPRAARLPATIPAKAVTVNGGAVASASVRKWTVTLVVARPAGVTCDSITTGPLSIAFSSAAHIDVRTARTATVTHATGVYEARITVKA